MTSSISLSPDWGKDEESFKECVVGVCNEQLGVRGEQLAPVVFERIFELLLHSADDLQLVPENARQWIRFAAIRACDFIDAAEDVDTNARRLRGVGPQRFLPYPSQEELKLLPPWALVALLARISRYAISDNVVWPTLPFNPQALCKSAVEVAEQSAEKGEFVGDDSLIRDTLQLSEISMRADIDHYISAGYARANCMGSLLAATLLAACYTEKNADPMHAHAHQKIMNMQGSHPDTHLDALGFAACAMGSAQGRFGYHYLYTRTPYELILAESQRNEWIDSTVVPVDFFLLRTAFPYQPSIEVVSTINSRLLNFIRCEPSLVRQISPRNFERLIAELFRGMNYEVELTAQTRDGGYDVAAIRHSEIGAQRFLIECKHYREDRKVSIGAVRALHGTVIHEEATKGIIVTTSDFSQPAIDYCLQHQYLLEPRGYQGLLEWLKRYHDSAIWSVS